MKSYQKNNKYSFLTGQRNMIKDKKRENTMVEDKISY